ncbi:uncharacterized protein LOC130649584 [Hydractinia symbiolongicarpus]|uniref:uncharacterized protein LOC130649584 n=1 Tax=Hydractinia symbiolongicarpus TaxID=13093 RepID=UPI002551C2AB|nr:uncharacterized protein LOC130649584 [Hydractinia symbiolongicarpus]
MVISKSTKCLIRQYFLDGLSYEEIRTFLFTKHDVHIGIRQLNRVLRSMNLFRRYKPSTTNSVLIAIKREISGSGEGFGYRLMTQKLRSDSFNVDRETVRMAMKAMDPSGVEERSKHRFKRRKYFSRGPNFVWHMDGYDKLKPFGFAIHGAIDGWSRKILWLNVGASNNNPKIIAAYFLKCVTRLQSTSRCIRADRGSENVVVGGIQRFFRRDGEDDSSGEKSFRYGPSTRNQRIESWWCQFRKNRCNYWINYFKDLCDEGTLDTSIDYHLDCLRFSYLTLLQTDLDQTVSLWNNHRIRKVRNSESPAGRPNVLYHLPERDGGEDYKCSVNSNDLAVAEIHIQQPLLFGCSEVMSELLAIIMNEKQMTLPNSTEKAKELFKVLTEEMYNLL